MNTGSVLIVITNLDIRKQMNAIFIDNLNGFDTLNHAIILTELKDYGCLWSRT